MTTKVFREDVIASTLKSVVINNAVDGKLSEIPYTLQVDADWGMANDLANLKIPSQYSIKKYVDANIGGVAYHDDFVISDWLSSGGVYYIDFNHGLDTIYTDVEVKEGAGTVFCDIVTQSVNVTRIQIPSDINSRFDGSIIISK